MSIDVNVQNDLVIVTETTEDIVVNVSNAAGPQGPAGPAGVGVPVGGTIGQVLKKFTNTNYDTYWAADASGLTSVGLSVPTGLTVTNSPLTTNGTIAVGLASGYSIPTTASQATWNTAYNDSIVSAAVTGTTTKTLTLNQQDGGSVTASWSDLNTDAVTSVFGRTGAVVATEGDYTLTQLGDVTLTSPTNGQVLKYNGTTWVNNTDTDTGLTSVGLTMPSAFSVANSPLTSNGTIAVTGAGLATQYIRGDGQLATFPSTASGGSSVNYYLNGSVNASVAGYKQLDNNAIVGGGTDFTLVGNGLIAQFLTDAGNPNRIQIPGGAWNFEMYFQVSSAGGNQKFYIELHKYDGSTFSLIASSSAVPEEITGGTSIDLYLTSLAVPTTTLLTTDRLAIRVYIVDNAVGRTITLHTENTTLCEIITTFSGGVSSLNGLSANTQYLATGTSGTDFSINSVTDTHTFNLPIASGTNTGKLSNTDWTIFNNKVSSNIYTADGTLTGDRSLTQGGFNLSFIGGTYTNRFTATGRLLLGTTTESIYLLDVSGNIRCSNAVVLGGITFQTGTTNLTGPPGTAFIIYSATTLDFNSPSFRFYTSYTSGGVGNAAFMNTPALYIGASIPTFKPSALLELDSTTKGFLPPRMTTTQRDAISSPAIGLQIYNSTTNANNYYDGTAWVSQQSVITNPVTGTGTTNYLPKWTSGSAIGNSQVFDNGTNVGIGTASPDAFLRVAGTTKIGEGVASNTSKLMVNTTNGVAAGIQLFQDGVESWIIQNIASSTALTFGNSGTERARITSGGNLLVGSSVDSGEKLQVSGAIIATTGFTVSGNGGIANGANRFNLDYFSGNARLYSLGVNTSTKGGFEFHTNSSDGSIDVIALNIAGSGAATFSSSVTATSFIKSGGTSSQYLMADGSVTTGGGGSSVDELQVALLSQVYG